MQKRWTQNQDSDRVQPEDSGINYSKLFVLSGREPSEVEFTTLFGKYGEVVDLKQIKDHVSGRFKGENYTIRPRY